MSSPRIEHFLEVEDYYDEEHNVRITDNGLLCMKALCEIVLNKHYSYVELSVREDLISVGHLKILEMLNKKEFNPTRSSLKNYLYTCVRNEMGNYLYRNTKEIQIDEEILYSLNESKANVTLDMEKAIIFIPLEEVVTVIKLFKVPRTSIINIVHRLGILGLKVQGFSDIREEDCICTEKEERLCTLIIWRHLEACQ